MRNNQPVTHREYELQDDDFLISRTDLKGRITYANPAFVEVSGFSREELIGAPHNIVRHPDMPTQAFDNFWSTLKAGETWEGLVKNRRKNGDYYWVRASVTPIVEEGAVQGYASVRVKADAREVVRAERVYAQMREGRKTGYRLARGTLQRRGVHGWLSRLNLSTTRARLISIIGLAAVLLVASGGLGIFAQNEAGKRLQQLNENGLTDVARLQQLERSMVSGRDMLGEHIDAPRADEVQAMSSDVEETAERIDTLWSEYMSRDVNRNDATEAFTESLRRYVDDGMMTVLQGMTGDDYYGAYTAYNDILVDEGNVLRDRISEMVADKQEDARELAVAARDDQQRLVMVQVALLVVGMALLILLGGLTIRALLKPLRESMHFTLQMAAGNLGAKAPRRGRDEVGRLMNALNVMKSCLGSIVSDVNSGVSVVTPAARDIASANDDLSSRTEEQAASLQETASSMEQMTGTVRQNADNARQASQLAVNNASSVGESGELMNQVVDTMERITASSKKMTEIIGLIDSIAFQTNILALNASVEAARAGEQGRGFAVVAGEVRSLAGRSADAAKDIRELIDSSAHEIDSGASLVKRAESSIGEVVSSSQQVNDIMGEITAASEEQSSGLSQINQAIAQMDEVTQQNAERVQSSARAAADLENQALMLSNAVAAFRLSGSGAETAKEAKAEVKSTKRQAAQANERVAQVERGAKRIENNDAEFSQESASGQRQLASATDEWEEF
ncbi:methyl-accepting chemotaxis protein [Aidingimonas lacisalsi]|uniref:methyl-accepting chemotaxis protein n=1 Tax=Aidingimonas lacisalsi TaxID=2604086 RepID=UPI0011D2860F|nr:PAS domain-containing methyl-accepting chemotaxis protein [Aidingimonas lacisalsi]